MNPDANKPQQGQGVLFSPQVIKQAVKYYQYAINYQLGRGVPIDLAKELNNLHLAATSGHAGACYELAMHFLRSNPANAQFYANQTCPDDTRYNSSAPLHDQKQKIADLLGLKASLNYKIESDKKLFADFRRVFINRDGLEEEIKRRIFPSILSVHVITGRMGTGFFYYPSWFVTNAHVVPSKVELDSAEVCDQRKPLTFKVSESYHRPSENSLAPDIAIVNTHESFTAVPQHVGSWPSDKQHYCFYVDLNLSSNGQPTIHYLAYKSGANSYPMIFECFGDHEPEPGSSGSPIIVAWLNSESLKWEFKTIGILYARCSTHWYSCNQRDSISSDVRLVCAIPLGPDLEQILKILQERSMAERLQQMSAASSILGDHQRSLHHHKQGEVSSMTAKEKLLDYEAGMSSLDITLPDGLEKLYWKTHGIVPIGWSLMLRDILKSVARDKRDKKLFDLITEATLDELEQSFEEILQCIGQHPIITIPGEKIQNNLFRVDIDGSVDKGWKIDIQDNTGMHHVSNREPTSSTFAIATIPIGYTHVSGKALEVGLRKSQHEPVNGKRLAQVVEGVDVKAQSVATRQSKIQLLAITLKPNFTELIATIRDLEPFNLHARLSSEVGAISIAGNLQLNLNSCYKSNTWMFEIHNFNDHTSQAVASPSTFAIATLDIDNEELTQELLDSLATALEISQEKGEVQAVKIEAAPNPAAAKPAAIMMGAQQAAAKNGAKKPMTKSGAARPTATKKG